MSLIWFESCIFFIILNSFPQVESRMLVLQEFSFLLQGWYLHDKTDKCGVGLEKAAIIR